jgi:hypothetical protein
MSPTAHVVRMRDIKNAYEILYGKPEFETSWGELRRR